MRICNFQLVTNSNFGHVSYVFEILTHLARNTSEK